MQNSFSGRLMVSLTLALCLAGCMQHEQQRQQMAAENSKTAQSVYKVGHSMHMAGDRATAVRMYKQALELDEDFIPALTGLAQLARDSRQTKDTTILLEKALERHPEHLSLMLETSKLYISSGQGSKAEKLLHKYLLQKESLDSLNAMGVAHDLQGHHLKAQEFYKRALAYDPHNRGCLSNMGISLAVQGKYKESIGFLEPLMERDNPLPRERQNLATAYALSGQVEKARKLYRLDMDQQMANDNLAALKVIAGHHNQPIVTENPSSAKPVRPLLKKKLLKKAAS